MNIGQDCLNILFIGCPSYCVQFYTVFGMAIRPNIISKWGRHKESDKFGRINLRSNKNSVSLPGTWMLIGPSLTQPRIHLANRGFLYQMVAHFTMHTSGLNEAVRFVESIWFHRKSRQVRIKAKIGKDLYCLLRSQHVLSYHPIYWYHLANSFLRYSTSDLGVMI